MMNQNELMYCYWGKANKELDYHLLVYHSLDVAAVARVYLETHPALLSWMAKQLSLEKEICLRLILFFVALHDLGKFSETFQNQVSEVFQKLSPNIKNHINAYDIRHDCLGLLFWKHKGFELFRNFGFVCGDKVGEYKEAFGYWIKAVTGHHGQPSFIMRHNKVTRYFSDQDSSAAEQVMFVVRQLFLDDLLSLGIKNIDQFINDSKRVSWWLSGLTILADWIGSDSTIFKYATENKKPKDYWNEVYEIAKQAIIKKGLTPNKVLKNQNFQQLFNKLDPTPLQQKVINLPLLKKPQLFILEDVTGAGKTEAALMLAYRLIERRLGQGIYVALPTMATANAMYERMQDVYQKLFVQNTASLILAHGKNQLQKEFKQSIVSGFSNEIEIHSGELEAAGSRCHAWFADNRKKVLLADVGVGTLDQALQAVLPNKHQSLRLLGLFGKILIIDEVHAYDSYMQCLLEKVLSFHAASGGSTILLSATLPTDMRTKLVKSFSKGLTKENQEKNKEEYPLLTHTADNYFENYPILTRKEVIRTVIVKQSDNSMEVEQIILNALQQGQCVCWVRNTVHDAIESYQRLAEYVNSDDLMLFHARFTMADRLAIESKVLQHFGKNSTFEQRKGKCLIATQVVEQSLDIDFDFMVSDLAPIDLLIQRAGRLQRHKRAGRDETNPTFLVYGPLPVAEPKANWLAEFFPKSQKIYENHAQLWLTAKLLEDKGMFSMPEDARDLIEGVYGKDANIPEGLLTNHLNALGNNGAESSIAYWSGLDLDGGYDKKPESGSWQDEKYVSTRLSDGTVIFRLAKWQHDQLTPWHPEEDEPWYMSEVNLRIGLVKKPAEIENSALRKAVEWAEQQLPDKGKWSVLLPLQFDNEQNCWVGEALDAKDKLITIRYNSEKGLH